MKYVLMLMSMAITMFAQADPIVIFPPPGCPASCFGCHSWVPGNCANRGLQAKPSSPAQTKVVAPRLITNRIGSNEVSTALFVVRVPGIVSLDSKYGDPTYPHPAHVAVSDPVLIDKIKRTMQARE